MERELGVAAYDRCQNRILRGVTGVATAWTKELPDGNYDGSSESYEVDGVDVHCAKHPFGNENYLASRIPAVRADHPIIKQWLVEYLGCASCPYVDTVTDREFIETTEAGKVTREFHFKADAAIAEESISASTAV